MEVFHHRDRHKVASGRGAVLLVRPVDSRRVFVLGAAGLVPAALVTLLLVHQPSIGDRRLYPMLRGPLTLVGLGLALATLITWATAPDRLSRSSLSGLAWAGVTRAVVHRPVPREHARARLFALNWARATSRGRRVGPADGAPGSSTRTSWLPRCGRCSSASIRRPGGRR